MYARALPVLSHDDHFGRLTARSGLTFGHNIHVGAGTIDRDYRGEIRVHVFNLGDRDQVIDEGMRFAQLIVQPVAAPVVVETQELPATERGEGGVGSTGLSDVLPAAGGDGSPARVAVASSAAASSGYLDTPTGGEESSGNHGGTKFVNTGTGITAFLNGDTDTEE